MFPSYSLQAPTRSSMLHFMQNFTQMNAALPARHHPEQGGQGNINVFQNRIAYRKQDWR